MRLPMLARVNARLRRHGRLLVLATALAGGAASTLQCGSSDESLFTNATASPCESTYKGLCGKACATDGECAAGLYCGPTGTCTADCAPGHDCSSGVACSPRGRCGDLAGSFGDAGDLDASSNGDAFCAATDVTLAKIVPKVLFLLDQSSSMSFNKFPSGNSNGCNPDCRWTVLKDVLIGPANNPGGLLKDLEGQAEIAVELYSATDAVLNDGDDSQLTGPTDNVCPRFNGKTFDGLNFELKAFADAETLLRPASVDDDTPTGPAIRTVIGLADDAGVADPKGFAALPSTAPKVLVLVTDGEPAICGANSPSTEGRALVVQAVQDTFKQNIRTFVIAIGDISGTGQQHFNAVANAGQGLDPNTGDAGAILPSTPQALLDALKKVVLDARTCTYDLNGQVTAGQEKLGTVTLNGTPVPYDDPGAPDEGWRLVTPSQIELVGSACATLKAAADAVLSARFPCGAVTSVPK